jgi:hypothetical protein
MSYTIAQETLGGLTVTVEYDDSGCSDNPIDDESVVKLCLAGSLSHLGNVEGTRDLERDKYNALESISELPDSLYDVYDDMTDSHVVTLNNAFDRHFLSLPVYCYQHGNIALSTGSFSCPWDSGMAGLVYMSKDDARQWYNVKRLSKRTQDKTDSILSGIVKNVGQWANGEVYGWEVVDSDGETLDSCWGYIGDSDYALSEGIDSARYHIRAIKKRRANRLKTLIRNRTPLSTRAPILATIN